MVHEKKTINMSAPFWRFMDEQMTIKKFIVRKLYRKRMWMHKHTNINNLPKGLSNELRSSKQVKKAIESLLKEGILLSKPTHYGLEVSLNINKKREIEAMAD